MKVSAYIRVSSQEQVQGYSLDAQRYAIHRECEHQDYEIIAEHSDEGISARHDDLSKRPGFQAAILDVTSGRAEAIIVHKLDRAARRLRVLLDVMGQIGDALISVVEKIDTTTPQGRMFTNMLGVLAEYYSDNLSQEIRKGKDQRRREGMFNGRIPFGYRKPEGADNKTPVEPDDTPTVCTIADREEWSPERAVRRIFELNAQGTSLPLIAHELTSIGFSFRSSEIHQIVRSRFYLGEIPLCHGKKTVGWIPGRHLPIISEELYRRAETARVRNRNGGATVRRSANVYALTGLVRCFRCRGPMYGRSDVSKAGTKTVRFYCSNHAVNRSCDQPSFAAARLEEIVGDWLDYYSVAPELALAAAKKIGSPSRSLARERATLEQRRKRLADLFSWGDLLESEYLRQKNEIDQRLFEISVSSDSRSRIEQVAHALSHLGDEYRSAIPRNRNAIASRVFSEILVDEKQVVAYRLVPTLDRIFRQTIDDLSRQNQLSERRRQK